MTDTAMQIKTRIPIITVPAMTVTVGIMTLLWLTVVGNTVLVVGRLLVVISGIAAVVTVVEMLTGEFVVCTVTVAVVDPLFL